MKTYYILKQLTLKFLLLSCLIALPFKNAISSALSNTMYCTVKELYSFNNDNLIKDKKKLEFLFKTEANKSFIVSRKDGGVNGKAISNDGMDITVLDDAAKEGQSVKILWNTSQQYAKKGYKHAAYLEIHNFVSSVQKPFLLVWRGMVISGTCE